LGIDGYKKAEPAIKAYLDSVKGYKKNKFKPPGGLLKERIDKEWKLWFDRFGY
jgi:hypothetical protein